ncbi:MAG: ExbD/TolR family protein [Rickettsiales bacterium]|nr:ExbD/TolR family protein [Rickettsiales bacterium]
MALISFNSPNNKKKRIISDINITPFVDVLLVLLIIFMVAAPLMTSGIKVDLPQGASSPIDEKMQPIIVSIKPDGVIFLQEESLRLGLLGPRLLATAVNNLNTKIYVRADQNLDYGRVMEVVKSINLTGFNQVILVTELAK